MIVACSCERRILTPLETKLFNIRQIFYVNPSKNTII